MTSWKQGPIATHPDSRMQEADMMMNWAPNKAVASGYSNDGSLWLFTVNTDGKNITSFGPLYFVGYTDDDHLGDVVGVIPIALGRLDSTHGCICFSRGHTVPVGVGDYFSDPLAVFEVIGDTITIGTPVDLDQNSVNPTGLSSYSENRSSWVGVHSSTLVSVGLQYASTWDGDLRNEVATATLDLSTLSVTGVTVTELPQSVLNIENELDIITFDGDYALTDYSWRTANTPTYYKQVLGTFQASTFSTGTLVGPDDFAAEEVYIGMVHLQTGLNLVVCGESVDPHGIEVESVRHTGGTLVLSALAHTTSTIPGHSTWNAIDTPCRMSDYSAVLPLTAGTVGHENSAVVSITVDPVTFDVTVETSSPFSSEAWYFSADLDNGVSFLMNDFGTQYSVIQPAGPGLVWGIQFGPN